MFGVLAFPLRRSQVEAERRMNEEPVTLRPHVVPGAALASATGARELDATAPLDFDAVYTEHFHHVSRWARALGGLSADLDDLTQEVFLVVRRKLSSFDGPSVQAWLYGITRKTVSDYRRRAWMRRVFSGLTRSLDAEPSRAHAHEPQHVHGPGMDATERWEAQRILRRVLDQMSDVRRTAFILFEIEGYSGEEIAELEGIPVATVYTRLHHARKDFLRMTAELTGEPNQEPTP